MKKGLALVGVLGLVALGWFIFQGSSIDHVATVDDEVTQLELELAKIDAALLAGTLTPEDAAEAQVKIIKRLNTISDSVSGSQNDKLTDSQRVMLLSGLDRLNNVLIRYQATLVSVDETLAELPEADRPKLNKGSGGRRNLPVILTETIGSVEDYVEETVDGYVADDEGGIGENASTTDENTEEEVEGESTIEFEKEGEIPKDSTPVGAEVESDAEVSSE